MTHQLPIASAREQSETINANFTYILNGFAKARRILMGIGISAPMSPQEEATFEKSQEELLTGEPGKGEFPPMPIPKNRKKKK